MSIDIHPLAPQHRSGWQPLAQAYKAFYRTPTTDQEYDQAWRRLMAAQDVRGLGASIDGRLVGIAHFLHHGSTCGTCMQCCAQAHHDVPIRAMSAGPPMEHESHIWSAVITAVPAIGLAPHVLLSTAGAGVCSGQQDI